MALHDLPAQIRALAAELAQHVREHPLRAAVYAALALAGAWVLGRALAGFRGWDLRALLRRPAGDLPGGAALRRKARRLVRAGTHREAARLFETAGDLDRAAEQYERGRAYAEAAEVHQRAHRWARAAALYERAGNPIRAAESFLQAGDSRRAAALFLKAGRELRAAEALEQGRVYAEAAALYERAGSLEKAAALHERAGTFAAGGEALERHLAARYGGRSGELSAPAPLPPEAGAVLQRCVELYRRARQPQRAAGVLLHWGEAQEAARLFLEAGEPRRALELYRAAGRWTEAMDVCQLLGAEAELHALRAEQLAAAGQAREAAEAWEQAGEVERAAEAYRELREFGRAGALFARAGQQEAAGEMFEAAGQWGEAAAAFAAAGRWRPAGRCYRKAGMAAEAAAALAKGRDFFGAGVLLAEAGAAEEAIALLQQVPPDAPEAVPGALILARLLLTRGLAQTAQVRLRAIEGHPGAAGKTAEVNYLLGLASEAMDQRDEALSRYERVLAERLDYEDAKARVAELRGRIAGLAGADKSAVLLGAPQGVPARYRVVRELGRGGMGIVFEAHDQVLRRPIALKVPAPAIVSAPCARERFLREARIAAGLRHPNIITIYDAGETEGGLYIAMELIEGLTLAAHLHARGPLPPAQFLALARQMCAGLGHAHARSIVHADVKPANMIVDAAGTVHITDFGLARAWEGADSATLEARGTPSYISPEQVRCEALDARTDVYGLGCTLYHMAAGAPPFTRGEVLYRHLHEAPPGFRERNPDASEALEEVILRCLAKRPEDRFPSMDSLWAALKVTLPSDPSARPDGGPGAPAPPR